MPPTDKSYWLRSGLFMLLERVSILCVGIGNYILLVRTLSMGEMGAWVLFLTVTAFIEVGKDGLLQNALIKYLTTSGEDEYTKINTASLFLNVSLCLLSILFLLGFGEILSNFWNIPDLKTMLTVFCLTIVFLIPFSHGRFVQQANLDFRGIFWSSFTRQGALFAFVLFFFISGRDITLVNLAIWQCMASFCGAIVSVAFGKKYMRFSRVLDKEWVGRLFSYGKFVWGTNLSAMIYKRVDVMMIGKLLSPGPVALYDLAIRITNLAEVPTVSIASIVFPQSAKKMISEGTAAVKELYEKSVGAILALILPFFMIIMLFPGPIISLFNEEYLEAIPLLRLTIFYGLFIPFSIQFGTVLDSIGKPKINFYFVLFGSFLNVIFNYIFITNFGVVGAAYGTLITYTIHFILTQILLYKMFNIKAYKAISHIPTFYKQAYHMGIDFLKDLGKKDDDDELLTKQNSVEEKTL